MFLGCHTWTFDRELPNKRKCLKYSVRNNFLLKTSRAFKTSDVAEIFIAFWESYEKRTIA